jgi:predicted enzyme related to lactoylglutathione lyase
MHYRSGGSCECTDNQGVRFDLFEPAAGFAPDEQPAAATDIPGMRYYVTWVPDPTKARDFYAPLFGWEFEEQNQGWHTNSSNIPFGFHPSTERLGSQLWYRVERIAEVRDRVLVLGGTAGEITDSPAGLSCDCTDDQGQEFSIWQPAPGF